MLLKGVAQSLGIHPFMLSKWRKQVRDGEIKGKLPSLDLAAAGDLQRLRELEQKYKRPKMEHDILEGVHILFRLDYSCASFREVLGLC